MRRLRALLCVAACLHAAALPVPPRRGAGRQPHGLTPEPQPPADSHAAAEGGRVDARSARRRAEAQLRDLATLLVMGDAAARGESLSRFKGPNAAADLERDDALPEMEVRSLVYTSTSIRVYSTRDRCPPPRGPYRVDGRAWSCASSAGAPPPQLPPRHPRRQGASHALGARAVRWRGRGALSYFVSSYTLRETAARPRGAPVGLTVVWECVSVLPNCRRTAMSIALHCCHE